MGRKAPAALVSPDATPPASFSASVCLEDSEHLALNESLEHKKTNACPTQGQSPSLVPTPLTSPGASSCASSISAVSSPVSAASDFCGRSRDLFSHQVSPTTQLATFSLSEHGFPPLASAAPPGCSAAPAGDATKQAGCQDVALTANGLSVFSVERIQRICGERDAQLPGLPPRRSFIMQSPQKSGESASCFQKVSHKADNADGLLEQSRDLSLSTCPGRILRIALFHSSRTTTASDAGAEFLSSSWDGHSSGAISPSGDSATDGKAGAVAHSREQSAIQNVTDASGENTVSTSQTIRSSRSVSRKSSLERGGDLQCAAQEESARCKDNPSQESEAARSHSEEESQEAGAPGVGLPVVGGNEARLLLFADRRGASSDVCQGSGNPFTADVDSLAVTSLDSTSELLRSLSPGLTDTLGHIGACPQDTEDDRMSFERLESFCDAVHTPQLLRIPRGSPLLDNGSAGPCSNNAAVQVSGTVTGQTCEGAGETGNEAGAARRCYPREERDDARKSTLAVSGGALHLERGSGMERGEPLLPLTSQEVETPPAQVDWDSPHRHMATTATKEAGRTHDLRERTDVEAPGVDYGIVSAFTPAGEGAHRVDSVASVHPKQAVPKDTVGSACEGRRDSAFRCACCGDLLLCSQCSGTGDFHEADTAVRGRLTGALSRSPEQDAAGRREREGSEGRSGAVVSGQGPCRLCAESIYCGLCVYRMQATVSMSCASTSERTERSSVMQGLPDSFVRRPSTAGLAIEELSSRELALVAPANAAIPSAGGAMRELDVGTSSLLDMRSVRQGCGVSVPCGSLHVGDTTMMPVALSGWFPHSAFGCQIERKPDGSGLVDRSAVKPPLGDTRAINRLASHFLCGSVVLEAHGEGAVQAVQDQPSQHHVRCSRQPSYQHVPRPHAAAHDLGQIVWRTCAPPSVAGAHGVQMNSVTRACCSRIVDSVDGRKQAPQQLTYETVVTHSQAAGCSPIPTALYRGSEQALSHVAAAGGAASLPNSALDSTLRPIGPLPAAPEVGVEGLAGSAGGGACTARITARAPGKLLVRCGQRGQFRGNQLQSKDTRAAEWRDGQTDVDAQPAMARNAYHTAAEPYAECQRSGSGAVLSSRWSATGVLQNGGRLTPVVVNRETTRAVGLSGFRCSGSLSGNDIDCARLLRPRGYSTASGRSQDRDKTATRSVSGIAAALPHQGFQRHEPVSATSRLQVDCNPAGHVMDLAPAKPRDMSCAVVSPGYGHLALSSFTGKVAFPLSPPTRECVPGLENHSSCHSAFDDICNRPVGGCDLEERPADADDGSAAGKQLVQRVQEFPDPMSDPSAKRRRLYRCNGGQTDVAGNVWCAEEPRTVAPSAPGMAARDLSRHGVSSVSATGSAQRTLPQRCGAPDVSMQEHRTSTRTDLSNSQPVREACSPPCVSGVSRIQRCMTGGMPSRQQSCPKVEDAGEQDAAGLRTRKRFGKKQPLVDACTQRAWGSLREDSMCVKTEDRTSQSGGDRDAVDGRTANAGVHGPSDSTEMVKCADKALELPQSRDNEGNDKSDEHGRMCRHDSHDVRNPCQRRSPEGGFSSSCAEYKRGEAKLAPASGNDSPRASVKQWANSTDMSGRHHGGRHSGDGVVCSEESRCAGPDRASREIAARRRITSPEMPSMLSKGTTVPQGAKTCKRRRGERSAVGDECSAGEGDASSGSRAMYHEVGNTQAVVQEDATESRREREGRGQAVGRSKGDFSDIARPEGAEQKEAHSSEQESSSPPGRGSNGRFWRAGGDGRVLYDQAGQKISGIWFDSGRRLWRVVFTQGERRRTKGFSLRQYGFEEARNMAVQCKLEMEARKGEKMTAAMSTGK
ncbi:hypothetical protein BESB_054010 [Besnoitia besnoiti]|uniref:AP2/ERF domain-containing protein n=1 Tax=Besnoitia besnoiti TaxID=94643 RepID=A0A2A9MK14_BESBE|nr:hypothetical protein BESB_054010 [Besnoitia besnoiti]PFH35750.1 hypothetical protein BESB_054010 [Besnoitia besnoiti]